MDIDISPAARRQLEAFLVQRFDMTTPVKLSAAPGGRSNKDTHLVAIDANGERASLKYVSGHHSDPRSKKHLLPTENIAVAGQLSLVLETPAPIDSDMIGPIEGLGPLDGHRFAARRWHGEAIGQVREDIEAHRAAFLEQYGEWVAFGLLFALGDGKQEHWTWDVGGRTVGRCDLELLFFEQGKVSDYRAPLDMLGVRASVKSGEGADFEAFARGVRAMVEKSRGRRAEVQEVLKSVDDHTRTFLDGHGWASLTPEDFVQAVLEGL